MGFYRSGNFVGIGYSATFNRFIIGVAVCETRD